MTAAPRRANGAITADVADRARLGAARRPGLGLRRRRSRPRAGERYLGFGSRSNAVDQTGNRVFSWAEEGPFSSGDGEDVAAPAPARTSPSPPDPPPRTSRSPGSSPPAASGFLIDQTERSHLRPAQRARRRLAGPGRGAAVRASPSSPARGPPTWCAATPTTPAASPSPRAWFFGPWVQFKDPWPERFRDARRADDGGSDLHPLPALRRAPRQRGARAARRPSATTASATRSPPTSTRTSAQTYQPVYDEAAARRGCFVKNPPGPALPAHQPVHRATRSSRRSTSPTPAGATLFGRLLDDAIADGYDGWMEDFGEYTPTDSVFHDGKRGLEMHNRYPVDLPRRLDRAHGRRGAATSPSSSAPATTACSPTRAWSGAATPPRTGAARTASARRCTRR